MSNTKGERIPEVRSIDSKRAEAVRFSFVTALTEKATVSGRAKRARWSVQGDKIRQIRS